jgi:hypothetical protein
MPRVSGVAANGGIRMSSKEVLKGLKSIKVRAPNRKFSTAAYKSGLPKAYETSDR